ncbi:28S ribosomal protein S33 mitochondrial [Taenia crassiceps]|uniref:28S ribosomal protein S33 mitochondrial n=1 Tax=Taenia crassiceps TaxID=6207 RepID=A0ABR4Q3K8_9CEST
MRVCKALHRPSLSFSCDVIQKHYVFEASSIIGEQNIWRYFISEYSAILSQLRQVGLFRDEHADFRDEMDRLRALRGKKKLPKCGCLDPGGILCFYSYKLGDNNFQ